MRKSWLLCALLGAMAWGQAQPVQTPASAEGPSGALKAGSTATPSAAEVPESAAVITIVGVCSPTPKAAAVSKTAAGKEAAAKKPADCKTVITRAKFEKLASALQQGTTPLTPQQKHMLATQLPGLIAMSDAAEEKGLEKSVRFEETMKFLKMRVLSSELQHAVQEEADNVPEQEIDEYYKKHPQAYEQFSLERLFIPRFKQENAEKVNPEEKLSEEQQKTKDAAERAKQEQGEQDMTKLADSLRARAAAGEDFTKLQKEAFEAAGMKMDAPTVSLPTVRSTGLPPGHAAVFDLKAGEVSQVLSDNGGHYVYKVVSKQTLPLEQVKQEIHATLKMQRMKEMMDKYTNSYKAETNEAYFGPSTPTGPGGRPMLPRPPRVQPAGNAPPATNSQSQPSAQPAPPSKPN
ncbi:MAG: peptidylprolyl isomerase [Candidatus Sulfotelmatobacter sp.]